jgi:hypothetical protein
MSGLSTQALHNELERRQRRVGQLERKAARLRTAVERVEVKIAALGGPAGGTKARRGGGTRPTNKEGLAESLARLLKGRSMNVTGAAAAVQKAGYLTASPNFRTIVNQTLINSGRFKRVSRGVYSAK